MNKFFCSLALLAVIPLASCNLNNENDVTDTRSYQTANLFTPDDASVPASAVTSVYKLTQYPNKGTLDMDASLKLDGIQYTFSLSDVSSVFAYSPQGEASNFEAKQPTVSSGKAVIKNLIGSVTPYFYYYQSPFASQIGADVFSPRLVMKYSIDGVGTVVTFPVDAFYSGVSTVEGVDAGGSPKIFTTKDMVYRLSIQVDKQLATLIVYKARFKENSTDEEVYEALVFENLKVEYRHGAYAVSGSDIVPSLIGASGKNPAPEYTADNIAFVTANEYLTKGNININFVSGESFVFTGLYFYDGTQN